MSTTLLQSAGDAPRTTRGSTRARSAGRAMTGIAVLFLAFDTAIKLFLLPQAVEGTTTLGFRQEHVLTIGLIEVICLALYLYPRTAVLGAVLWTGYLGGAIATHLRLDNPLFSHTLFPIYIAALLWGGLYLRDARVRTMIAPKP